MLCIWSHIAHDLLEHLYLDILTFFNLTFKTCNAIITTLIVGPNISCHISYSTTRNPIFWVTTALFSISTYFHFVHFIWVNSFKMCQFYNFHSHKVVFLRFMNTHTHTQKIYEHTLNTLSVYGFISLHGHMTFNYSFFCQRVVSIFGLVPTVCHVQDLVWLCLYFLDEKLLVCLTLWLMFWVSKLFSKVVTPFHVLSGDVWRFQCLYSINNPYITYSPHSYFFHLKNMNSTRW